jgi:AcrR family transcriptional regulator
MTTEAKMTTTAPTRRERQRAATYDEIVTVARDLLGKPETLSLRAIAAEMGLTAPALYRYVDSYHELLMLVAQAIFEDVIGAMTLARDRYGDDDPAAQTLAATVAFRWRIRRSSGSSSPTRRSPGRPRVRKPGRPALTRSTPAPLKTPPTPCPRSTCQRRAVRGSGSSSPISSGACGTATSSTFPRTPSSSRTC